MSHFLLPYNHGRKNLPYNGLYSRSSDLKHNAKAGPTTMAHKINFRLERVFECLYKKVLLRYFTFFRNLKMLLDTNFHQDRIFEKRLFKYIERIFVILKQNNLRLENMCFRAIKNHVDGKLLFERVNFVVMRIGLKTLATSSRVQRFRKALLNSSKKTKLHNQGLKARYLMAVCENFMSKKSVSKELYKSFREWHLQSVLKKLSALNEDQRDMVWQQKIVIARLLRNCVIKVLRKAFCQIKTHNVGILFVHERLSYHLKLNYLIEKVSAPFIKHVLLNFPNANWNSSRLDAFSLLKTCYFFKRLMLYRDSKAKVPHEKQRAGLLLANLIQNRIFLATRYGFDSIASIPPQHPAHVENNVPRVNHVGANHISPLYNALRKLIQKRYIDGFTQILHVNKSSQAMQTSSNTVKIQNACGILEIIALRHSQQVQRSFLYHWRRAQQTVKRQHISEARKRIKLLKLKKILSNSINNTLNDAFQALIEFSIERPYIENEEQDLQGEQELSVEGKVLSDMIKNQAIINAKLEAKHRRRAEESFIMTNQYRKEKALETILYKLYQNHQSNRQVLQKVFGKWQTKVSFDDKKIVGYENFIMILESEINFITLEIEQIEQAKLESEEDRLRIALGYLNRLEILNSELMEVVGEYEADPEEQELAEPLPEANSIRRRYSM